MSELFRDGDGEGQREDLRSNGRVRREGVTKEVERANGGAREVIEPPLCAVCVVECEVDGLDRGAVLQRGLRRIDRVDGGLTRRRWELGGDQMIYKGAATLSRNPKVSGDSDGEQRMAC